ncbi:MAG: phosphoglycolate phosphatase [Nitrosospira sp.]|nr:phosphoglycolate phosphatase [Nitrosospira sp.]MBI0408900.1 phosphoglycolate phosphatase [Nitrosospira sp.]MBI0409952.1 phosphoglycolate phosphatase [Nitrosospira sp.]MBI0412077.1 phosphoglycolate phosphatase [Nitrosospira sp.]MBI0420195.1 phosphoglycolate phosphatase [Nitrosospira sp.]
MIKDFQKAADSAAQKGVLLPVKAVMIDLDGTLLDTAGDLAAAANSMLRELGREELPVETIRSYIGKGIQKLVKRSLTGSLDDEPDATLFAKAMPIYEREYANTLCVNTFPYPGVIDGLNALQRQGFRLACITNKAEAFTQPLLRGTGLLDYFEIVLSGDSLPRRKPDPLPLLHACKHFGILPNEMLLIGDSLNDTEAARAAGCYVFCVPYGYNEGRDVRELDCDAIVVSIDEASRLVCKSP